MTTTFIKTPCAPVVAVPLPPGPPSSSGPTQVEIVSSCAAPVFIENCNQKRDTEFTARCDMLADGSIREYFTVARYDVETGDLVSSGDFTGPDGQTAYVPVNPVPCPGESSAAGDIIRRCLCDDVNGDLSDIVNYTEALFQSVDATGALEVTNLGTFTDNTLTVAYTPVNPIDCDMIGDTVVGTQPCLENLIGAGTWSRPANAESATVTVLAAGSNSSVSIITADGPHNLVAGQWAGWSASHNTLLVDVLQVVTTDPADHVTITFTKAITA